jgi:excisionase family DNA binding protein
MAESAMWNLKETAAVLGVHPNTVKEWSSQRRLPFYRFSTRGDRRFRREDIEFFIGLHRCEAQEPTSSPGGRPDGC